MEAGEVGPTCNVPWAQQRRRRQTKNKTAKVHSRVQSEIMNESESKFDSDSAVSAECRMCLSGFVSQSYTMDDIKCFLSQTKYAKRLRLINTSLALRNLWPKQNCAFVNEKQEGYHLIKFITKLTILTLICEKHTHNGDKANAADWALEWYGLSLSFLF